MLFMFQTHSSLNNKCSVVHVCISDIFCLPPPPTRLTDIQDAEIEVGDGGPGLPTPCVGESGIAVCYTLQTNIGAGQ